MSLSINDFNPEIVKFWRHHGYKPEVSGLALTSGERIYCPLATISNTVRYYFYDFELQTFSEADMLNIVKNIKDINLVIRKFWQERGEVISNFNENVISFNSVNPKTRAIKLIAQHLLPVNKMLYLFNDKIIPEEHMLRITKIPWLI